jgi:hypothetical protein
MPMHYSAWCLANKDDGRSHRARGVGQQAPARRPWLTPVFRPIATRTPISTGFVESTINQLIAKRFVKKQQMRWTPRGAHLLLQVRVQTLNDDLHATFERWYPALRNQPRKELAA